ncbi:Predicted ATPase [Streptomyces wuyuanensis]|uniref:Predicted ATPase n=1 Tax=Streptomyces wuyuanensis TaxID=1196353 RepID=A0A1G9YU01_9ACTN|nr:Predicted ATPase [Streptomyces wuyuanensis]
MAVGCPPPAVRVEVLGPLRLLVDGTGVDVPGPKRRAVLALLALSEGRIVTVDRLVDALWPSQVPDSGRQALHNHVSRLRGHLGAASDRLETRHDGYRLVLGDGELDLAQARALLEAARHDGTGGYDLLRQAHELWRGPVLADLTGVEPIAAAVEDCARLRQDVTDALVAQAIATGRAEQVLNLAAASSAADPLREPAVLLLMRALAATGQAPRALHTAREYRRRLIDETGLDPSPALDATEHDILTGTPPAPQTPAPVAPPSTAQTPRTPPPPPADSTAGPVPHPWEPATAPRETSATAQPDAPAPSGPPAPPASTAPGDAPCRAATRLIGREPQLRTLRELLAAERLVTLVGPGGVGKTRLALEVARQDGAAIVLRLAPVTDSAALAHALATALNLKVDRGDVLSACLAVLADRPGLLVVDNCEHLLDGVRDAVDTILAGCPGTTLLATSREPLGLPAEHLFRLAPLALPQPGEDPAQVPSSALFLDRARRVRPGPPPTEEELRTVAGIVHRLDGMPLAIELAAGRLSTFSLNDLNRRLERSLDLLAGGTPSADRRHRTLRATLEWSYRLLTADEQRLFRHLAVFPDGVDLDTAEQIADGLGLDSDPGAVLARLVDASMVEASFEGTTRYRMLQTLRAFALDRLSASGEDDAAARGLLAWARRLTAWIGTTLDSRGESEADGTLRRELPNLRAAWRLARARGAVDDAAAVVTALYDAVAYRDLVEIRDWAVELAADDALDGHPLAGEVLGTAAEATYHRGDYRGGGPAGPRRTGGTGPHDRGVALPLGPLGGRSGPGSLRRGGRALPRRSRAQRSAPGEPGDRRPRHRLRGRHGRGAASERAGAGWGGFALDAGVGRLRRRGDRQPVGPQRVRRGAVRTRRRTGPCRGGDVPRRGRDGGTVVAACPYGPGPRGSGRLSRGHRLLRPQRQLDPSVGHTAQSRRTAAPARRRRTGGADRNGGRPRPRRACRGGPRERRPRPWRRRPAGRGRGAGRPGPACLRPGRGAGRGPAGDRAEPLPDRAAVRRRRPGRRPDRSCGRGGCRRLLTVVVRRPGGRA